MRGYRIRLFLSESRWQDTVIFADNGWNAQSMAQAQSPVGRAILLGEA